jgi:uncharacterized membrane protein YedE/YeeE
MRKIPKPYAAAKFDVPATKTVDAKLVLAGLLFGAGWGISGMCPGPALVAAVATPLSPILAYVGAMMGGFWLQGLLTPGNKPAPKAATQ